MEGLDEETRKEIEELLKVTCEEHGGKFFAQAQFNLGALFLEKKYFEKALNTLSNIEHSHSPNLYAAAQYHIGDLLERNGDTKLALQVWENIRHSDNPEIYAASQSYMGFILSESNDNEGALLAWRNIKHIDSPEQYAQAQFNIGVYLSQNINKKEALLAWNNINRLDNPALYAQAQFNIGSILLENNKVEDALLALDSIEKHDDAEAYSRAQLKIGNTLLEMGEHQSALLALCNIEHSNNPEAYAKAQFKIASFLLDFGQNQAALSAWQRIERLDDKEAYAKAQFNIAVLLNKNSNIEDALNAFRNIKHDDDVEAYGKAQYAIGKIFISDNNLKDYLTAKESFALAKNIFPYEAKCYVEVCDLLAKESTAEIGIKYLSFFEKILKIVGVLKIKFLDVKGDINNPERKMAHYTNTDVANILLDSNKDNRAGYLRLNTITNMNDPSEGQLLESFLKDEKNLSYNTPDFDENSHAFFSCFTFNHDSLNQFRLYGKKDYQEASGVSLVFNQTFFQNKNLGGLSFVTVSSELNNVLVENHTGFMSEEEQDYNNKAIGKQPVMRCVYIDAKSGYIQLAQRNKLTFYRELGSTDAADEGWASYQKFIQKKTKEFQKHFEELKSLYKELVNEKEKMRGKSQEVVKSHERLLDETLLPLKYLIKHSAFQEEQECRMIYITSLKDPKVKMDFGKFLYVEYDADVKTHLDKIYIGEFPKNCVTAYNPLTGE